MVLLDWDETVSSHDTLSLIAPPDDAHPGPAFSAYSEAYMSDLATHDESYADKQRTTLGAQLQYLESLDAVELASQRRIEEGGLFLDFDPVAMEERARERVRLRDGWRESMAGMLNGCRDSSTRIEHHFISVGWSARFIAAALQGTTTPTSMCANEVQIDPHTQRGTGRLTKSSDAGYAEGRGGIRVAQHKSREMRRIMKGREGSVTVVYAGDSNTDLPCLMDADVGLILGTSKSLLATIDRLGLRAHLSNSVEEWKEKRRGSAISKPDLILVQDWFKGAEVIAALQ